jgi:hypothetical protein
MLKLEKIQEGLWKSNHGEFFVSKMADSSYSVSDSNIYENDQPHFYSNNHETLMSARRNIEYMLRSKGKHLPFASLDVLEPKEHLDEEAPINNVGSGNIAGAGVGPDGEPGVPRNKQARNKSPILKALKMMRRKKQQLSLAAMVSRKLDESKVKRGRFAGYTTFIVPSEVYERVGVSQLSKKDRQWWKTYIGEDAYGRVIREYAVKNPKHAVVLENEYTGAMCFLRYGKRK